MVVIMKSDATDQDIRQVVQRIEGRSYLEIAEAGGGIRSSQTGFSRMTSGTATARDIMKSLSAVSRNMKRIEDMAANVSKMLYGRLKKSIESLVESRVDDVRLYTEVAILADKQDINEEIVRLMDHVGKMKRVLAEKGQAGKRLDFLAQEMFREITTISSKSNSSEISHLVVDIKNHIDKIREQSRNIV